MASFKPVAFFSVHTLFSEPVEFVDFLKDWVALKVVCTWWFKGLHAVAVVSKLMFFAAYVFATFLRQSVLR